MAAFEEKYKDDPEPCSGCMKRDKRIAELEATIAEMSDLVERLKKARRGNSREGLQMLGDKMAGLIETLSDEVDECDEIIAQKEKKITELTKRIQELEAALQFVISEPRAFYRQDSSAINHIKKLLDTNKETNDE